MNEDKHTFYIIGNYKIEFHRTMNPFSYSPYSKYKFTIQFKDTTTDLILAQIETNEKRMYDLVINLYQYNMYSFYQMYNERIWFDPNTNGEIFILEIQDLNDTVLEFDEIEIYMSKLTLCQYNQYNGFTLPRISILFNQYQLEDFIYQAFLTLEGINNIKEISRSEWDEYLDFCRENDDAINYI